MKTGGKTHSADKAGSAAGFHTGYSRSDSNHITVNEAEDIPQLGSSSEPTGTGTRASLLVGTDPRKVRTTCVICVTLVH